MTLSLGFVCLTEFTEPIPDGPYEAQADHAHRYGPSATDQSWEEQRFLRLRVENARDYGITGCITRCSGVAERRELPKPLFGLQQGLAVVLIEPVSGVAAMIHNDLSCHR